MKQLLKRISAEWEKALFWACVAVFTAMLLAWLSGRDRDTMTFSKKTAPSVRSMLNPSALGFLEKIPPSEAEGDNPFSFIFKRAKKRRPWSVASPNTATAATTDAPRKRWKLPTRGDVPKKQPPTTATAVATVTKVTPVPPKKTPPIVTKKVEKKAPVTVTEKPVEKVAAPAVTTVAPKEAPPKEAPKEAVAKTTTAKPKPTKPPVERVVTFQGIMQTATGKQVAWVQVYDPAAKDKEPVTRYLTVGRKLEGVEIRAVTSSSLSVVDPQGRESTIAFRQSGKITIE